ncbi:MAG: N-methylhydantoinase B [Gammaproteobacteria bacterium]|jgi:N-methylhydantoinase B
MSAAIDPVTMQVVGNYLRTVTNEVEVAMIRAAYSPVIKEAFDCSAGIIDPSSEYWAQADAIPIQCSVLASVHRGMLDAYDQPLVPGDILFTNDPWAGCPHLNDFVSIAPVFAGDEIIAYVCTLMHQTDVGGMTPGSMPADASEIYQEGFRVPVQRLFSAEGFNEPVLNILLANSRTPSSFRGDLAAQVAGSKLGVRRLEQALVRFGKDRLVAHAQAYVDYSERLVRDQLRRLRAGTYSASRRVDGRDYDSSDEGIMVIADVTIDDGQVAVDFSRSSAQVPRPLNCVLSNAIAPSLVALRCMLDADVPMNGGLQRALSVSCKEGLILNPVLPAPVGARAMVATLAYDCVLECLGHSAPEGGCATSSGGTTMPFVWTPTAVPGSEARILVDNSLTGGTGARGDADGMDAVDNSVTNAMNYPAEMLEQEYPVLVERHELRLDSGGPGRFRGGLGMRRTLRFLVAGTLALRGHRHQYPPPGINAGEAGAPTRFTLERQGTLSALAPQASSVATEPGDRFIAETPGGGGFGDAAQRECDALEHDLAMGYISAEHASTVYRRDK